MISNLAQDLDSQPDLYPDPRSRHPARLYTPTWDLAYRPNFAPQPKIRLRTLIWDPTSNLRPSHSWPRHWPKTWPWWSKYGSRVGSGLGLGIRSWVGTQSASRVHWWGWKRVLKNVFLLYKDKPFLWIWWKQVHSKIFFEKC